MNLSECPSDTLTPSLFNAVVTVLFSLVVILGLFGNALVILVILANRHMRNSTNILITSLAVADLLFITLCVPFTALFYIFTWKFGYIWCVIFQYFTYVPVYGSVYTLVLMSVDRYLAVVHPIRSIAWRTKTNTVLAVAATWLAIAASHVPFALDVDVVIMHPCGLNCNASVVTSSCQPVEIGICTNVKFFSDPLAGRFSWQGKIFYTAFNAFGYVLPFALIIALYVLLVKRLLFGRATRLAQSTEAVRSKRRVTRTVVTVIVIFGTCWLPIHVIFALQNWHGDLEEGWFRYLQVASQVLAYMNSCMNPIVYAFVSDNFRQAFASFLGIKLKPRTRQRKPLLLARMQQPELQRDQLLRDQQSSLLAMEDGLTCMNGGAVDSGSHQMELLPVRTTLELTVQVHSSNKECEDEDGVAI